MGGIAWSIEWFDPSVQTSTALTHFTAGEQDRFQGAELGQRDRSVFSETNMVINERQHAHVRVCDVESSSGAAGDTHTHTHGYILLNAFRTLVAVTVSVCMWVVTV